MDRSMWQCHLALATEHVALAQRNVAGQRDVVARLDRDGHPTELARQILKTYEDVLSVMLEDRERLSENLARPLSAH